ASLTTTREVPILAHVPKAVINIRLELVPEPAFPPVDIRYICEDGEGHTYPSGMANLPSLSVMTDAPLSSALGATIELRSLELAAYNATEAPPTACDPAF